MFQLGSNQVYSGQISLSPLTSIQVINQYYRLLSKLYISFYCKWLLSPNLGLMPYQNFKLRLVRCLLRRNRTRLKKKIKFVTVEETSLAFHLGTHTWLWVINSLMPITFSFYILEKNNNCKSYFHRIFWAR